MNDRRVIALLPSSLITLIAAGETIERPSSVLKEILENAVDAEARMIKVRLDSGGIDRISVIDDGVGIPRDELLIALMPYTTNKIVLPSDLEAISSMGFRGEALSSIAAVSQLTLTSRTPSMKHAWCIKAGDPCINPASGFVGTAVDVRQLFDKVPARRKYLRSKSTERRHCLEVMTRVAIAHPQIAFRLFYHEQLHCHWSAGSLTQRICDVFDNELIENFLYVNSKNEEFSISGWIENPRVIGAHKTCRYLYVNNRYVQSSIVSHALRTAYLETSSHNLKPSYVLFISIDSSLVDVNVHPTKQKIRFYDAGSVYDYILKSIRQIINKTDLVCTKREKSITTSILNENIFFPDISVRHQLHVTNMPRVPYLTRYGIVPKNIKKTRDYKVSRLGTPLAQFYLTHIIAQNTQGLVLVDVRMACKHILYEKLKKATEEIFIMCQEFSPPIIFQANRAAIDLLQRYRVQLDKWGFGLIPKENSFIAVQRLPKCLPVESLNTIGDAILSALESVKLPRSLSDKRFSFLSAIASHSASCHKHKLTLAEMESMLHKIDAIGSPYMYNQSCRTWIQLSLLELTQLFLKVRT